jgi:hypothetical protein
MTFAELVDETVEYYTTNPRSITAYLRCVYAGPNGERCAAARLCDESASDFKWMDAYDLTDWSCVGHLATLKPEYSHFDNEQIRALQILHDISRNWLEPDSDRGTEGLSEEGKEYVEFIKSKF